MKIIYKPGDLLEASEIFIAHGCNAQGKYASGVAGLISKKYPSAYEIYMKMEKKIGTTSFAVIDNDRVVINCITQEYYGYDSKKYVSYDAIARCIQNISSMAHGSYLDDYYLGFPCPITEVAFPKIGAGLAGGDWNEIEYIIEEYSLRFQPIVYELPIT